MFAVWTVMSCRAPQGKASVFGRVAAGVHGTAVSVAHLMASSIQLTGRHDT